MCFDLFSSLQDIGWVHFLAKDLAAQLKKVSVTPPNIIGLSLVQLIEALVPLSPEANRLVGGMSLALVQGSEAEGEPPLIQPQGTRGLKGATPLFELGAVPLPLPAVWSPEGGAGGDQPRGRFGAGGGEARSAKEPRTSPLRGSSLQPGGPGEGNRRLSGALPTHRSYPHSC